MNAFDTVMGFTDNEYPVTEGIGNSLKKIMAFFKRTFTKNKASSTVKDLDAATKKAKDINDKLVNSDYNNAEVVSGEVIEDAVNSMNSSVMSAKEFDEVMKKKERELKEAEKDLGDKKSQFANNHGQRMDEIRKAYQNIMSNKIEEDESDLDIMKELDEIYADFDNL